MPDQSSRKTTLQTPGYYAQVWLSVMTGSEVLNASVSATPTYAALNLAITVNSGSAANVKRGMRIVLQSSVGAYKGTLIVRSTGTISSANIPTREFGKGFANVVSGDVLRVYSDFPIADKLVAADETFAPDQLAYSDQNTAPAPVTCSGGSWAGWLADAAAIPFTGSNSYTLGTGGTITHAWTSSGGTLSSAVAADPTFNPVAAGKYLITHTTTDNVNSKVRTQYTRVRAHDASDPPIDVLLTQPPSCDEDQGWRCRIRLFDNADLTSLPDYAHVILWTNAQTFGCATPGRHHILMDGYLRRDEQNINPILNTIEFDVISPLAALAELPGFSKVMVTTASPDAWSEFGTGALDVQRAIIQLPLFYTTLIESGTDFIFVDFNNAVYSAFFLVKDNPLAQMRELAAGRGGRIVCHKNGRFEVQPRLDLQPLATRSVLATTYSIDANDVDAGTDGTDGIVVTREHKRVVETFRARGFTAGSTANDPVFAKWPEAPSMGNQNTIVERLIVDDAAQLFAWDGMLGAAADGVFQNGAVDFAIAPTLRVPLRGAYWAIFDFFHEWIAFTSDYGTSSNLRAVNLSAFRWQFRGLSLDWDENGLPRAVLELKAETAGQPGIDDTPEATDIVPPPPFDDPPLAPPGTGNTGLTRSGDLYAFDATAGGVWLLERTSLTWTFIIDLVALGMSGTLLGATWRVGGNVARILTTTKHAKLNNYSSGTPALASIYTFPETSQDRQFNFERSEIDWGLIASYIPGTGVRVDYTLDGGVTVTRVSPGGVFNNVDSNGSNHPRPGVWLDPHYAGRALISVFSVGGAMGAGLTGAIYQTLDHGATWAALGSSSPNQWLANSIVVAFQDAASSYKFHGYTTNTGSVEFDLYRNDTKVSPSYSGTEYGYVQGYRSVGISDDDQNTILLIAAAVANSSTVGVWLSRDRGTTWTVLVTPATSVYARQVYAVSANLAYFCGLNGYVGVWSGGSTIDDLTIPTGGEVVALMGP